MGDFCKSKTNAWKITVTTFAALTEKKGLSHKTRPGTIAMLKKIPVRERNTVTENCTLS